MRKRIVLATLCFVLVGWWFFSLLQTREARARYPIEKPFYFYGDLNHIRDGDQLVILRNQNTDLRVALTGRKSWNPARAVEIEVATERRKIGSETFHFPIWKKALVFHRKMLDPDSFVKIIFHLNEKESGSVSLSKCEVTTERHNPGILILGMDGATLTILEPLMAAGRCPNFKKLLQEGSYGPLTSEEPTYSPVIWTTLATGRPPADHGITFYLATSGTPVTSEDVRVKRFWQIFSNFSNLTSAIVGWYLTWPVEQLKGAMIADTAYYNFKVPDLSFPPAIFDQDYRRLISGINTEMLKSLRRFTSFPYDGNWKNKFGKTNPMRELSSIVHQRLVHVYRRDTSFAEYGLKLQKSIDPDVLAVYLRGADFTSHGFWKFRAPDDVPFLKVADQEKQWFRDVIDQYYIYLDELLGKYLENAHEDTNVFVISDHGFQAVSEKEAQNPELSGTHEINGLLFCKGPAFRKAYRIPKASIYDFLPTMLAAAGLPQAQDMPGRVLTDAMDPEFLRTHPLKRIPTYGTSKDVKQQKSNNKLDDEIKQELRSLGYIQ